MHTLSKKIRKIVASKISYHKGRGSKNIPSSKFQVGDRKKNSFVMICLFKADRSQVLHQSGTTGPVLPEFPKFASKCHFSELKNLLSEWKSNNAVLCEGLVNVGFYPPEQT